MNDLQKIKKKISELEVAIRQENNEAAEKLLEEICAEAKLLEIDLRMKLKKKK